MIKSLYKLVLTTSDTEDELKKVLLDKESVSKIKKIYIQNNKATELSPVHIKAIVSIPLISVLHLDGNLLQFLPQELCCLINLKKLYLQDNQLVKLQPSDPIFKLIHLEELFLSQNKIEELSGDISKLTNLRTLDLTNNRIKSLPVELSELTKLKRLDLTENPCAFPNDTICKQGTKKILQFLAEEKRRVGTMTKSKSATSIRGIFYRT
jgi:Leucine-rich repeat (LRR) protein